MPCKEIYILLHFYSQINEPGLAEDLCSVCGWVKLSLEVEGECVSEDEKLT